MHKILSYLNYLNKIWMLHRWVDVDCPQRPRRIIFRVLQSFMDSISTRVWKSYSTILDWIGQAAPVDSRTLPGSFRSTSHQWNLVLCPIFQFLGRQLFYQLQVDHRRIFWRCRIRCDGGEQRLAIHNVRRRSRWVCKRQLCQPGRWWVLVCHLVYLCLHDDINKERWFQVVQSQRSDLLVCRRSFFVVLVYRIRRWRSPDNTSHDRIAWMDPTHIIIILGHNVMLCGLTFPGNWLMC